MTTKLKKLKINKFARNLLQNPHLLTCNSYLNFLRFYQIQHPRFGLRRILQNGCKIWLHMDSMQREQFTQKNILAAQDIRPRIKWHTKKSLKKLPRKRLPRSYRKRNLNAEKNIQRRKRFMRRFLKYGHQKFPGQFN